MVITLPIPGFVSGVSLVVHCRRGELMGLQWNCVDLDKGIVIIKQALLYTKDKGVYVGPPKTGRPRAVCLAPETVALLKKYRTERLCIKMRHADIWQDTDFLFTKEDGMEFLPSHFLSKS